MRRAALPLKKKPLVREIEWKEKSARSKITTIVDVKGNDSPESSSIATAPGKRARVGKSPERDDPRGFMSGEQPDQHSSEEQTGERKRRYVCKFIILQRVY